MTKRASACRPPGPLRRRGPRRVDDDLDLELRPGETELGRPPQGPVDLAPLTAEEVAALKALDEEQAAKDLAEAELLLASDPTGLGWLGWFGSPLAFAFLMGMAGVFGIFLFNQTVSLLNALAAQPEWAQYIGYGGLILFGICVLYAFLRFVFLYVRLRENRQLRIRGIEELSRRTRLRWLAAAKSAEAREQIEKYLRTFPMNTEKERKTLRKIGLDDAAQGRMAAVRAELLDPDRFASTEQWFARFRDGFQSELDVGRRGAHQVLGVAYLGRDRGGAERDGRFRRDAVLHLLAPLRPLPGLQPAPAPGRGNGGVARPRVLQCVSRGAGDRVGETGGGAVRPALPRGDERGGRGGESNMVGKVLGKVGRRRRRAT